ncbi:MAG: hypothetical protein HF978_00640 [Desulfobacteraceae bacterium]|nr:hypothetical protein [Desulfobacteraceae bacterium]MBC2754042.1 hypothetical protein [Desulfobacteraceae bacterium]
MAKKKCQIHLKTGFKNQIRSEDKAPADEKAEHTNVCEHFEEDGNAVIGP